MTYRVPVLDGPVRFGQPDKPATLQETMFGGYYANVASVAGVRVRPMTDIALGPPLQACVLVNVWKVICPDCNGAEFLWPDESLFMCCSCWNGSVQGRWRLVTVPPNKVAIERVLMARPVPITRNWLPGELLADLKRENVKRGLPEEVVDK